MFYLNILIVIGNVKDVPKSMRKQLVDHLNSVKNNKKPIPYGVSSKYNYPYKGDYYYLVYISGNVENDYIYEALFHELDHLKTRLMNNKGIKDEETSAYITGYFARCTRKLVRELLMD